MKKIKNILAIFTLVVLLSAKAWATDVWINDLRSVFAANNAIIYAVNLRTFNALDKNKNGIIEEDQGEQKGSFINAIDRLDELKQMGVNTILLMPITPVGKTKALGTAGSLYAPSSFNELNPQLKNNGGDLNIYDEARKFVEECHNRKMRVIVDLPCCGAYDLYLKKPGLFKKDKNQNPIVPADWTDVRLLDAGDNNIINTDVHNLYASFVDMVVDLNVDGIRANVASMKPYAFWKKLIEETRARNPQFLFLAESSDSWTKPQAEEAVFTPYNKLLDAGFDGYYGSYFNLKNWKSAQDLYSQVKLNQELSKKYANTKSVIGSFATHDEISPILINGPQYSKMIIWLNATLPLNSYFIDGFPTGDDYIYFWANKKAPKTFTDDEYYFVHRGQMDIFNFSKKPQGKYNDVLQNFVFANKFKLAMNKVVGTGSFATLRTTSPSVFSYVRAYDKISIIVMGNLDFKTTQSVKVFVPKLTPNLSTIPIKIENVPLIEKGKISTTLAPGEVQVIMVEGLNSK